MALPVRPRRPAARAVSLLVAAVIVAACAGEAPVASPGTAPGVPAATTPASEASASPAPADHTAASPAPAPPLAPPAPAAPAPAPPAPTPAPEEVPAVADDPAGLAAQLVEAELAIRTRPVEEVAAMGRLQQAAYRRLARAPQWRDQVVAAAPDTVRAAVAANSAAAIDLHAMHPPPPADAPLPRWRIVEPAPADHLLRLYREAEAEFGVPWGYLAAIHLVETRMSRIRGTSSAGAQGPMQFMPGTWAQYGEGDVHDDRDAIRAAARYLRAMGAPADMPRAVFRYNRDQRYVRAVLTYGEQLLADPRAYGGYHHWQVYYATTAGDVLLPVGYPDRPAVPVGAP